MHGNMFQNCAHACPSGYSNTRLKTAIIRGDTDETVKQHRVDVPCGVVQTVQSQAAHEDTQMALKFTHNVGMPWREASQVRMCSESQYVSVGEQEQVIRAQKATPQNVVSAGLKSVTSSVAAFIKKQPQKIQMSTNQ